MHEELWVYMNIQTFLPGIEPGLSACQRALLTTNYKILAVLRSGPRLHCRQTLRYGREHCVCFFWGSNGGFQCAVIGCVCFFRDQAMAFSVRSLVDHTAGRGRINLSSSCFHIILISGQVAKPKCRVTTDKVTSPCKLQVCCLCNAVMTITHVWPSGTLPAKGARLKSH
jgi:hypothetical protein